MEMQKHTVILDLSLINGFVSHGNQGRSGDKELKEKSYFPYPKP